MSYTRNFGFRSFANIVRIARNKTPKTGNAMVLGTAVLEDSALDETMKQAGDAEAVTPGCGVLVFEHIQVQGVDPQLTSPQDYPFNVAPLGRFAQIVHGVGVKIWLKNTADKPLYDGRQQTGATLVQDLAGLSRGDFLCPTDDVLGDASNHAGWRKADVGEAKWLHVDSVNIAAGLVEASFTF